MKRKLIAVAVTLGILIPAFAVLNERDLAQTLSVLRHELKSAYDTSNEMSTRLKGREDRQRARLVSMMQQSNELSLMLYSQKQDYTFDMTYALNEVSKQYEEFSSRKLPFDDIVKRLDIDIDRYDRLIHTLRSLPPSMVMEYVDSAGNVAYLQAHRGRPVPPEGFERGDRARPFPPEGFGLDEEACPFLLDSLGREDRDSCIFYATALMDMSVSRKEKLVRDSTYYSETAAMLKSAYDYAQERYKNVQAKIFRDGQTDYISLLKQFPRYWKTASADARDKYSLKPMDNIGSQWRGPMVAGFGIFVLVHLLVSLLVALVVMMLAFRKPSKFARIFRYSRVSMTMILTVTIFALSIMVVSSFSKEHFISMASRLLNEFAWMLAAIMVSLVIRYNDKPVGKGLLLYTPILTMCFIIIAFRIAFIPNSLLNIIFPPVLLLLTIIQAFTVPALRKQVKKGDLIFAWLSLLMMVVTTTVAFCGYVLLGVQLLIWWFFFLTLLQTITATYDLLEMFYNRHITEARRKYVEMHPDRPHRTDEDLIAVTWFHSLVKKAMLPIAIVLSLPLSMIMASGVFDLTGIFLEYYSTPFLNVEGYVSLSASRIVLVVMLYFVFDYLNYLFKALYRQYKITAIMAKSDGGFFNETDVNFTLAGNIIGICLWSIYVISLFVLLKIPTNAVKVIAAGLATGLGFAMKDILNNFFYGVQLMSGRLRVGDSIECDGVRGKVDSINYQTTQIVASDGSVMAFPNSTLFNKNFKNLTRNHSYELLSFEVGVKYGSDVEKVRSIILEALKPLCVRNKFGIEVVDPKFGIQVRFSGFGDNSVDLQIITFTTVEEHFTFAAKAKELIYNALNANDIEIPFPQRDVYLKSVPTKSE